ncbi:RIO1-domain-containing protein [Rozella allomycis CSF55]|uniref:Serine/threonine-protein kinase RIO1 n=1 Tax=Rozella allomycis (strain CSF55) TaxID=988480 RepID=A0A4P9YQB8_ROZAC|nr:RIO1-domain-containing protein [Rozella allomycis CSF55]
MDEIFDDKDLEYEDDFVIDSKLSVSQHKFDSRINLGHSVKNSIKTSVSKTNSYKVNDKSDRATTEQVLDPRTRMIIFKMLNQNVIFEINGCISTGKEANVYHAITESGEHRALKVYKTSILVFKDRDRYVSGNYRFRNGYSKHNPRKMVKVWAEKEMRNLRRLQSAGICCPEPILLRMHVILMTFVGDENGWAAPRLKDDDMTFEKAVDLYWQLVVILRKLYQNAKLVHADFSEVHNGQIVVIDVSQAVEHDHPLAFEFLRKDCLNITEFFKKKGIKTLTLRELFDFVTDITLADETSQVERLKKTVEEREFSDDQNIKLEHENKVFEQIYIPQTLDQVIDFEKDAKLLASGDTEEVKYYFFKHKILYQKITGLRMYDEDLSSVEDGEESEFSEEDLEDEEPTEIHKKDKEQPSKEEIKQNKKKIVKEANREKRKTKMKKSEKKQKINKSKGK